MPWIKIGSWQRYTHVTRAAENMCNTDFIWISMKIKKKKHSHRFWAPVLEKQAQSIFVCCHVRLTRLHYEVIEFCTEFDTSYNLRLEKYFT